MKKVEISTGIEWFLKSSNQIFTLRRPHCMQHNYAIQFQIPINFLKFSVDELHWIYTLGVIRQLNDLRTFLIN